MAKENFKNKLDGNELDLSLLGLDEIPVKEIASLVKATHIDLSCNHILNIPSSFCGLQQIVKLDLSKNVIESLPFNFGDLSRLQYLDLDSNRITMLPISFGQLKSLRWLDLKNNPLDPQLKAIAGDCVDAKQCQNCAKKVVNFMHKVEEQFLKEEEQSRQQLRDVGEKLKTQQLKKEKQPAKKATNVKKQQQQQTVTESRERSNLTEKRNKVTQVQPRSKVALNELQPQQNGKRKTNEKKQTKKSSSPSSTKSKGSRCWRFTSLLLAATFLLASTLAAVLCFYTGGDVSSEAIQNAIPNITADVTKLVDFTRIKLNDCVHWMDTDGRKTVSWATENVLHLLKEFSEIVILSFVHVKEKLVNFIASSSTVTMTAGNAKPM